MVPGGYQGRESAPRPSECSGRLDGLPRPVVLGMSLFEHGQDALDALADPQGQPSAIILGPREWERSGPLMRSSVSPSHPSHETGEPGTVRQHRTEYTQVVRRG